MVELGQIIQQMLRRQKMWRQYRQYLIIDHWERVVGKEIAAVTSAQRLHNQVLWVAVSDSTWAYHLTLLKPQLIKKLNKYAGENLVKDLFFQIGTDEQ